MNQNYVERIAEKFAEGHSFGLASFQCLAFVGSHSHGTYVPSTDPDAIDDVDVMGVVLPPPSYLLGLDTFEHWTRQWEEMDVVTYSLHKFVRLLLKGNPNVLGLLWLREEDYLLRGPAFEQLVAHRSLFAHKGVYASFAGYAAGQLHKMTSYSPAIQQEIDTLEETLNAAGWLTSEIMDGRSLPMPQGLDPDDANRKAARLKHLRAKYHAAYMGEKRRALVVKHGYDTKNAAHLIRLLAMCQTFLRTGELEVYRTHDADLLRAIKRGEWSLEDVKALAETLFAQVKQARDESTLADGPDVARISALVADIAGASLR